MFGYEKLDKATRSEIARRNGKKGGRPKGVLDKSTVYSMAVRAMIIRRVWEEREPLIESLMKKAKAGDVAAVRDLLDRAVGKSVEVAKNDTGVTIKIDC